MHDDLDIARALREQADQVVGAPSLAAAARRQAKRIRTRRYLRGGLVAAAALAVAVPTAPGLVKAFDPAPSDTRAGSTPGPEPGGTTTISLRGLDDGAEPSTGWLDRRTYYRADGAEVAMPTQLSDVAEYGDGAVGMSYSADPAGLVFVDQNGRIVQEVAGAGVAVSDDRQSVAWFDAASSKLVLTVDSGESIPQSADVPADLVAEPVGFSAGYLYSNLRTEDGREAGIRRDGFGDHPRLPMLFDALEMTAVSPEHLAAVVARAPDGGTCSAVFDGEGGQLWRTCDYLIEHFSADGRYALAAPSYGDGPGARSVAVLDVETGGVVETFEPVDAGFIESMAFEPDSQHLLVTVWDRRSAAIVRCELAGDNDCEAAVHPVPSAEVDLPFDLPRQP